MRLPWVSGERYRLLLIDWLQCPFVSIAGNYGMIKVAIIGAGQLGSRHLQALNLLEMPLTIYVVDPYEASLDLARSRFEASIGTFKHLITYHKTMDVLDAIDIAIVASTAGSRCHILTRLFQTTSVNHLILEKILFNSHQDYFDADALIQQTDTKVWVNCCMRMMSFYNQFHSQFHNTAMHYRVNGSQYGLVTNAIHYLDHVAHLTGSEEFTLDTRYLDKAIISSKRAGYYELTGTLIAQFSNGSMAYLHAGKAGNAPVQVELCNDEYRVISRESEQKAWISEGKNDWQWQEKAASIPFQSALTAELITSLLETNQAKLPDYKTSMAIHLQLLEPLKVFLNNNGLKSDVDYPFT